MKAMYLTRPDAEKIMIEADGDLEKLKNSRALNNDYQKLKKDILLLNNKILFHYFNYKGDVTREKDIRNYNYDLKFAMALYSLFSIENEEKLSLRDASNPQFWSFLSVVVIPDIVSARWSLYQHVRFYSQPSRIWLYTLWWYVHLSWQGDVESTFQILKNNSTDTILNLVERVSHKGYNIELYRTLMREYSKVNRKTIGSYKRDIFRTIMVNNTALTQTIEPSLFKNGVEDYIEKLFKMSNLVKRGTEYIYREE